MHPLQGVADTAAWVAYFRAIESERADALFVDPYARLLAGTHGQELWRRLPAGPLTWSLAVRTRLFDDVIVREAAAGRVDCVLNLGAGLDTRPYRLELPAGLQFIEVDQPALLEHKARLLQGTAARCQVERCALDLNNAAARRALFARIAEKHAAVLIVSEGLLVYLDEASVASLATDLRQALPRARWLLENISPRVLAQQHRRWGRRLRRAAAPQRFAPREGLTFYQRYGFVVQERYSLLREAQRLRREMRCAWLPRALAALSTRYRTTLHGMVEYALLGPGN